MNRKFNDEQINTGLRDFLENYRDKDTSEIQLLLEAEMQYTISGKEIIDFDTYNKKSLKMESRTCYRLCLEIFKKEPDRQDYSSILLRIMQKAWKQNPEYKVEILQEGACYEVLVKIGNKSLIKFKLNCKSKSDAKKIAAYESLKMMVPMAHTWILIENLPKVEILRRSVKFQKSSLAVEVEKGEKLFHRLYKEAGGVVLNTKIEVGFLEAQINGKEMRKKYENQLKNKQFSMITSKIHQKYNKKSLKFNCQNTETGIYLIDVCSGSDSLFKLECKAQNKTLSKNMAGLKYFELYDFETFKKLYKYYLKEECPESEAHQKKQILIEEQKTGEIKRSSMDLFSKEDENSGSGSAGLNTSKRLSRHSSQHHSTSQMETVKDILPTNTGSVKGGASKGEEERARSVKNQEETLVSSVRNSADLMRNSGEMMGIIAELNEISKIDLKQEDPDASFQKLGMDYGQELGIPAFGYGQDIDNTNPHNKNLESLKKEPNPANLSNANITTVDSIRVPSNPSAPSQHSMMTTLNRQPRNNEIKPFDTESVGGYSLRLNQENNFKGYEIRMPVIEEQSSKAEKSSHTHSLLTGNRSLNSSSDVSKIKQSFSNGQDASRNQISSSGIAEELAEQSGDEEPDPFDQDDGKEKGDQKSRNGGSLVGGSGKSGKSTPLDSDMSDGEDEEADAFEDVPEVNNLGNDGFGVGGGFKEPARQAHSLLGSGNSVSWTNSLSQKNSGIGGIIDKNSVQNSLLNSSKPVTSSLLASSKQEHSLLSSGSKTRPGRQNSRNRSRSRNRANKSSRMTESSTNLQIMSTNDPNNVLDNFCQKNKFLDDQEYHNLTGQLTASTAHLEEQNFVLRNILGGYNDLLDIILTKKFKYKFVKTVESQLMEDPSFKQVHESDIDLIPTIPDTVEEFEQAKPIFLEALRKYANLREFRTTPIKSLDNNQILIQVRLQYNTGSLGSFSYVAECHSRKYLNQCVLSTCPLLVVIKELAPAYYARLVQKEITRMVFQTLQFENQSLNLSGSFHNLSFSTIIQHSQKESEVASQHSYVKILNNLAGHQQERVRNERLGGQGYRITTRGGTAAPIIPQTANNVVPRPRIDSGNIGGLGGVNRNRGQSGGFGDMMSPGIEPNRANQLQIGPVMAQTGGLALQQQTIQNNQKQPKMNIISEPTTQQATPPTTSNENSLITRAPRQQPENLNNTLDQTARTESSVNSHPSGQRQQTIIPQNPNNTDISASSFSKATLSIRNSASSKKLGFKTMSQKKIEEAFRLVQTQLNCKIESIHYHDRCKDYVFEKFSKVKKRTEFYNQLNQHIKSQTYASLLNLIIQKQFKMPIDLTPKDFKVINFKLGGETLMDIFVGFKNKKEAKKIASLVIIRILCKFIYRKIDDGDLFTIEEENCEGNEFI